MSPDDPRHGTYAGYRAGCRRPCCRRAAADYARELYNERYLTGRGRLIDSTGTRRRIEALVALGYCWQTLDQHFGWPKSTTRNKHIKWARGGQVGTDFAAQIAEVYDRLSMRLPEDTYGNRRARLKAQRLGWVVPLAWDDIDDPDERPRMGTNRSRYTPEELAAEWDFLRRSGLSMTEAATRLGITPKAIEKALTRARKVA